MITYGEAKIQALQSAEVKDGLIKIEMLPHEPKMNYDKAAAYYNKKLFKYWITQLSDSIPESKRENVLKYLLGIRNEL